VIDVNRANPDLQHAWFLSIIKYAVHGIILTSCSMIFLIHCATDFEKNADLFL